MSVPDGFEPLRIGGEFVQRNGPLYRRLAADGTFELGFVVEPRHCNVMGICHGGMTAFFCDMLLPLAALHGVPALTGRFLPTISLQLDYLAPSPLGAWMLGRAQVLRCTRSMVFAQGLVSADGEPVARASGILKIGPPFGDAAQSGSPKQSTKVKYSDT